MLGLDDARVPPKQGEEYYKQMKARNKKCRLDSIIDWYCNGQGYYAVYEYDNCQ
jgi:hypothetical protein